jgi:hypothetical protein
VALRFIGQQLCKICDDDRGTPTLVDRRTRLLINNEQDLAAALKNGGEIRVDSSFTIVLSNTMDVTLPTKIIGGRFTKDSGPAFYITSSDVDLHGVSITGGGTAAGYEDDQKLIFAQGTQLAPLENLWVHDCKLSESRGDNIWIEWCNDSNISGNLIKRFLYSGVTVISGDGVVVDGNNISDSPLTPAVSNCYGIAVTDLDNTEIARSRNCTIVSNRVHLIDWEAIDTHGGDGLEITGNTVTASPRGIALVVGNATRLAAPQNCVVSGNIIDGSGVRERIRPGIFLGGIANSPADGTITGNSITNYPTPVYLNYIDRAKTYVGGNNQPLMDWAPITMDGGFIAHSTFTPEYRIDGNTVHLRGGVLPGDGGNRKIIGHLANSSAWPTTLTFVGYTQGSGGSAGNGTVGIWEDGTVEFFHDSGSDRYTYFLSGTYEAA